MEAVTYGLQSGNFGYVVMDTGKVFPWVRYCQWIVLTPVLLNQINRVGTYRILGFNANTMVIGEACMCNCVSVFLYACVWVFLCVNMCGVV